MSSSKPSRVLRIKMSNRSPSPAKSSTTPPSAKPRGPPPEPLIVFELLEMILLHLPMKDPLLAQRVSKRWASVIRTSPPIQRALYFLPLSLPNSTSDISPAALRALFMPNPLLAKAFEDCMYIAGILLDSKVRMASEKSTGYTLGVTLHSFPPGKEWEDRFRWKEASWRRMLVMQPPVEMVAVEDRRIAPDYDDCFCEYVRNKMGARMCDVLDLEEVGTQTVEV